MPPRHAYWTILIDNAPTAFRAHDRADLLPTFERLKQKQPEVTMKYFARGRLWESPEEARRQLERPDPSHARGRDWRPGGTHRDPRDRFRPKKGRPRFRGEWRDRLPNDRQSTEPKPPGEQQTRPQSANRGAWTRKKRHTRASLGHRPPRTGDPRRTDDRKVFGDRNRVGAPKPFSTRKPFGAPKVANDRKPPPKRPVEPAPTEPPKEAPAQSRRRDRRHSSKKARR
jgi:hypothetical protein